MLAVAVGAFMSLTSPGPRAVKIDLLFLGSPGTARSADA